MSTPTIHTRAAGAEVLGVNWADRIVSVVAAPYGRPALVEYRGEVWEEVIEPGAFDSVNSIAPQRIRVTGNIHAQMRSAPASVSTAAIGAG